MVACCKAACVSLKIYKYITNKITVLNVTAVLFPSFQLVTCLDQPRVEYPH